MAVAELVLEYVKVLVWPALIAGLLLLFRDQAKAALAHLTSAEVDALGVKASFTLLQETHDSLQAQERVLSEPPSDPRIVHLEAYVANQFARPDVVSGDNIEHRGVMAWRAFTRVVEEIVDVLGLPDDGTHTYDSARDSLTEAGIWTPEVRNAERLLSATVSRSLQRPELAVLFFETTRDLADLLVVEANNFIDAEADNYQQKEAT